MVDMTIEMVQRPVAVLTVADVQAQGQSEADVAGLIATAHEVLEASLNRLIGQRTLKTTFGQWAGSAVLPYDPTEILEVTAAEQPAAYLLDGRILTVEGESPVTLTYKCGWNRDTVPLRIRQALLVIVRDLISHPEILSGAAMYANEEVESLAGLYRVRR